MRFIAILIIIIILSTSVLAGKRSVYDIPDFNPEYKNFNSYFRKLEYYRHGFDDKGRPIVCKDSYHSYEKHYCSHVYYEDEYIPRNPFERNYHKILVKYI